MFLVNYLVRAYNQLLPQLMRGQLYSCSVFFVACLRIVIVHSVVVIHY